MLVRYFPLNNGEGGGFPRFLVLCQLLTVFCASSTRVCRHTAQNSAQCFGVQPSTEHVAATVEVQRGALMQAKTSVTRWEGRGGSSPSLSFVSSRTFFVTDFFLQAQREVADTQLELLVDVSGVWCFWCFYLMFVVFGVSGVFT